MTRKEALNKAIGILTYHQVNFCKSKEAVANMNEIIDALEKIDQECVADKDTNITATDCVKRQDVEDAIYDYSRSCDVNYAQIMEFIDKLPSVTPQQNRWIPVSERLPNFAGVYLVTRYFPNNVMNPTYLVDACFFDGADTWHNDNRINHDRKYLTNVVAWLEEPEPYKEIPTRAERSDKE